MLSVAVFHLGLAISVSKSDWRPAEPLVEAEGSFRYFE